MKLVALNPLYDVSARYARDSEYYHLLKATDPLNMLRYSAFSLLHDDAKPNLGGNPYGVHFLAPDEWNALQPVLDANLDALERGFDTRVEEEARYCAWCANFDCEGHNVYMSVQQKTALQRGIEIHKEFERVYTTHRRTDDKD